MNESYDRRPTTRPWPHQSILISILHFITIIIHHPSLSFPHPSLLFSSVFIFALFCFSLLFRVSKPPIPIQTLLSFYFLTSIPSILALDFGSRGWFLMQQQFQSDCRLQGLDSVVDSLESLFFYLFFIFWRKRRCSCGSVSRFSSEWLVMILRVFSDNW